MSIQLIVCFRIISKNNKEIQNLNKIKIAQNQEISTQKKIIFIQKLLIKLQEEIIGTPDDHVPAEEPREEKTNNFKI